MNKEKTCPECWCRNLYKDGKYYRCKECETLIEFCKGTGTIPADKEVREAFEKRFEGFLDCKLASKSEDLTYEDIGTDEIYGGFKAGYITAMEKAGRKAEKWDNLAKLIGCTDGGKYFNDMISAIENFNGKWKRGKP